MDGRTVEGRAGKGTVERIDGQPNRQKAMPTKEPIVEGREDVYRQGLGGIDEKLDRR